MKQGALILILVFGLLNVAGLAARQPPPRSQFEVIAVLQYVDFAARQAVIDGQAYLMAPDMVWLGLAPGVTPESQRSRLLNRRISYVLGRLEGRAVVTAIWVLPAARDY